MDKKRVGDGLALIMMEDDYTFMKVVDFNYEELSAAIKELKDILNIN